MTFAEWYKTYPRKVNPRDAEKAWGQALKRGVTPEQIAACTEIMKGTEWRGREKQHIPYPASFLRAQTFVDYEPVRESYEIEKGAESVPEKPRSHQHLCHCCTIRPPQYAWDCFEDICIWPGLYPCPEDQQRVKKELVLVKSHV